MAKTVIRLLPDNLFYIGKLESWLNDMASKGLHLKDMHSRHAVFTRGNPAYKRYCITELPQYPEGDILREYNDAYWDLTCGVNTLFNGEYVKKGYRLYVFETTDAEKSKLPADVFGDRKELYERYKTKRFAYVYYLIAAMVALVAAYFNMSEHYILFIPSILLTVSILFLILAVISAADRFSANKAAKTNKLLGKVTDKDWSGTEGISKTRLVVRTLCWVLIFADLIYINYALFAVSTKSNLDNIDSFISLEDIQQTEQNIGTTYGAFTPSLFVPSFYMAEEAGAYYGEDGTIKLTQYNIVYSKSIVPFAVSVASRNCALMRIIDNTAGNQVIFTDSKYFTKVTYTYSYSAGEYSIRMCLANKHEVIYIVYRGEKTAQDIVDTVERKLYD